MRKTIKKNSVFLLLLLLVINQACDKKQVFDEYQNIPNAAWETSNTLTFKFQAKDTVATKNLFINLRNNAEYPFSNLFLITEMKFPDGKQVVDTLEYDMADVTGKFLGTGITDVKENKLFYKENITFPSLGEYTFKVRQAMRKHNEINGVNALEGITEVGFRIENTK